MYNFFSRTAVTHFLYEGEIEKYQIPQIRVKTWCDIHQAYILPLPQNKYV